MSVQSQRPIKGEQKSQLCRATQLAKARMHWMTGETKQSDETTAELDYSRGPFLLSQGFGGEVVAIFSYVLFFGSGAGNRRGFGTFRFSCL